MLSHYPPYADQPERPIKRFLKVESVAAARFAQRSAPNVRLIVSTHHSSRRHPAWLRQTKRLFPHPLFAGCISLACSLVGILFAGVAIQVPGCWPMGIPSVLFFLGCFATASAAMTPADKEPTITSHDGQTVKPTVAILVLLIGFYSWLLTVAMHIFDAFFNNGPGSVKYYVTVGIGVTSTLFMQVYGKRVIREHFGAQGGRRLELSGRQAVYVTVFVVSLGIYGAWLMA